MRLGGGPYDVLSGWNAGGIATFAVGAFLNAPKTLDFFVTSLSISDPDEDALSALVLRVGREGARVLEAFEALPEPPVNASEAAATLPTELLTCGLLAIVDTYGLLDFASPCVIPAETILEVTSGFLARARCTADAAAADGSWALPVLVLTLARISGRDWKYSSRSPKKASFSCEESLVNTIACGR